MNSRSYEKRRNVSVITLSYAFNEAVKQARVNLGIPIEGFTSSRESKDWHRRHHEVNTSETYASMPSYYWHFPREFVELLESLSYACEASKVNYYPSVPLDRYAMDLIHTFDLPEEVVDQVKWYILSTGRSLGIGGELQLVVVPVDEGQEGTKYMVLVAGIDESTTKENWLDIWQNITLILKSSGVRKAPNKRSVDKLLLRDLSFWTKAMAGKTAREILDEWVEKYPEDEKLGEDSVRKAIKRIEKLLKLG